MKRMLVGVATAVLVSVLWLGCDWTTNTESFNTSKGAGVDLNFSGVYYGKLAGGRAVANTSGAPITRLVLQQSGNAVRVLDNNGSTYEGSVGAPGLIAEPGPLGYPAGAVLAQAQINFSGVDVIAGKKVNFAGVIHAVAVEHIEGETETSTDSSTQGYIHYTTNITTSVTGGTNITTTLTIIAYDEHGNKVYESVQTYTVTPSGQTYSDFVVIMDERSRVRKDEELRKYYITEANTQYRLEGTWIEEGGVNAAVDALSPGTAGLITTVTPATPTTGGETTTTTTTTE